MIFSETLEDYDDNVTSSLLEELAHDPNHLPSTSFYDLLPPMTASSAIYDDTPWTNSSPTTTTTTTKHSIMIEDDLSMQPPPSKKMRSDASNAKPFHRIPCKARGVSNEHNSNTAFIDVPVDAPHGLLLSCSNSECAKSGRKFRYCKVCAIPVAKRNFPKRHGHGIIDRADDLKDVDYAATFVNPTTTISSSSSSNTDSYSSCCQPCIPTTPPPRTLSAHQLCHEQSRASTTPNTDESRYQPAAAAEELLLPQIMMPAPVSPVRSTPSSPALTSGEKYWLTLLKDRPQQGTDMTEWIDKVIGCASTSAPTAGSDTNTMQQKQVDTCPNQQASPFGDDRPVQVTSRSSSDTSSNSSSSSDDSADDDPVGSFDRIPSNASFDLAFATENTSNC